MDDPTKDELGLGSALDRGQIEASRQRIQDAREHVERLEAEIACLEVEEVFEDYPQVEAVEAWAVAESDGIFAPTQVEARARLASNPDWEAVGHWDEMRHVECERADEWLGRAEADAADWASPKGDAAPVAAPPILAESKKAWAARKIYETPITAERRIADILEPWGPMLASERIELDRRDPLAKLGPALMGDMGYARWLSHRQKAAMDAQAEPGASKTKGAMRM